MTSEFTLELAQQLHDSNQIVDFDWAWQVLGYSRKDSAKRTLVSYFERDLDYFVQPPEESPEALPHDIFHIEVENSKPGRPTENIYLTVECFKEMGMLSKSEEGKQIRKYFLTCEAIAKQSVKVIPQLVEKLEQQNQVVEEQGKAIVLLQSQIQNLLPISADFIPPGWDADVWEKLPPQDKRHFKFMFRRRRFRPGNEVEIKALPAVTNHSLRLQQKAEVERLVGEVSEEEKQKFDALKQQVLKQYRSFGGES
ncbi:DNA-damage-inducible protein [Nostoc sp.]|uniref:DNA-damage-inducible protein n=1 Tax=Nostoc sp. TaxID=1180 RepID=UPI002FF20D18